MYTQSKYIIKKTLKNGDVILCNTLAEKPRVFKFDKSTGSNVIKSLENCDIDANDKFFNFLLSNMFIVDTDFNQLSYINYQYNKMTYGNKELCLTIVPTDNCNMKCIYCYEKTRYNVMTAENWDAIKKYIKNNLNRFSGLHIAWFGGEPLLCKKEIITFLEKIQSICKYYKKGFKSEIITNGLLLDYFTFEKLVLLGVRGYQITLDGFENMHNAKRITKNGSNGYKIIMQNLLDIKLKSKQRFHIVLRVNFFKKDEKEIVKFSKYLHNCFGDDNRFSINLQSVRDWGNKISDSLQITPYEESVELFSQTQEELRHFQDNISDLKEICSASIPQYYYINPDLSIYKCSMALYSDCKNGCIGYIDNNGKLHIDTTKEFLWTERNKIPIECNDCVYYGLCFSNVCPYSFLVKNKKNCNEFKFTVNNVINRLAKSTDYTRFGNEEKI